MTGDEEELIDAVASYKASGWTAITPAPRTAKQLQGPAIILVGSKAIGWNHVLTVKGPDRFARAGELVNRYNAAPVAAIPV